MTILKSFYLLVLILTLLRYARRGFALAREPVTSLERLCAEYPDVKFLATFLSRENQHELCVAARKFNNLMPFGCWWFLNNPSIVSEITRDVNRMFAGNFADWVETV